MKFQNKKGVVYEGVYQQDKLAFTINRRCILQNYSDLPSERMYQILAHDLILFN